MGDVVVAVVQFAPGTGDPMPAITEFADQAASAGARVIVFPEYSSWFSSPLPDDLTPYAEPIDGRFVTSLRGVALDTGAVVVAGMLELTPGGSVHNTLVAVDGVQVLAVYRKQHLYDAFGERESDRIAAGGLDDPQTFVVGGLTFGMITCYDLRFPESTRRVVDAGADVVLVPAEWVRGPLKEDHWETLLRARAIENTVYIAAADHVPPVGVGRSMIVDPSGVQVAGLGTQPDVAAAVVRSDEISRVRMTNPALALRRYAVVPR